MEGSVIDGKEQRVRPNINIPRWDQDWYVGRVAHSLDLTSPLNLIATNSEISHAKDIVTRYKEGEVMSVTLDELWKAKSLFDTAYQPQTGKKRFLFGQVSTLVPMKILIAFGMFTLYSKPVPHPFSSKVILGHSFSQSYSASINYNNRGTRYPISNTTLIISGLSGILTSTAVSLGCNGFIQSLPNIKGISRIIGNPLAYIQRFVPVFGIVSAHIISVPMLRISELIRGVELRDKDGKEIGEYSVMAGKKGIQKTIISRLCMTTPCLLMIPIIVKRYSIFLKYPRAVLPTQCLLTVMLFNFSVPLSVALFKERQKIHVDSLEPYVTERLKTKGFEEYVYFNKGL